VRARARAREGVRAIERECVRHPAQEREKGRAREHKTVKKIRLLEHKKITLA